MAGAALAFVALRFYAVTRYTLWSDEIFSLRVIHSTWRQLLSVVARDVVHPPLFYVILKLWAGVGGEGLVWLRLLPILTTIAALVPFFLLCRELGLTGRVAALALLLAAPNAFLVEYSQQVRMYGMLIFFSLASLWLFAGYGRSAPARRTAWLVALTAVNILLVYTQYYGWLVVGLEVIFLLLFDRVRLASMLLSTAVVAIAFAPWAWWVVREAIALGGLKGNLGWMSRPHLRDVAAFFGSLNGPYRAGFRLDPIRVTVGFLIFGVPVLLLLASALFRRSTNRAPGEGADRWVVRWLAVFAFGPVVASVGASWIQRQPIFEPRHMLIAVFPYFLLCALGILELRPRGLRAGILASSILWACLGGIERLPSRDRVSWGELVQRMAKSEGCGVSSPRPGETLYVIGRSNMIPIEYYLDRDARYPVAIRQVSTPGDIPAERSAWLAYQESVWGGWTSEGIRSFLSGAGYVVPCDFSSGTREHQGHLLRLEARAVPAPPSTP